MWIVTIINFDWSILKWQFKLQCYAEKKILTNGFKYCMTTSCVMYTTKESWLKSRTPFIPTTSIGPKNICNFLLFSFFFVVFSKSTSLKTLLNAILKINSTTKNTQILFVLIIAEHTWYVWLDTQREVAKIINYKLLQFHQLK